MKKMVLFIIFVIVLVSSNLIAELGERLGQAHSYYSYIDANGVEQGVLTLYYEFGSITTFEDGRPPIIWYYGQEDLPCCYGIVVYPNPKTGQESAFIEFNIDHNSMLNIQDIQSVTYEIYNSEQELLLTLEPINPLIAAELPSVYINTNGTYFIVCKVKFVDETYDEIRLPFTVLLRVVDDEN